MDFEPERFEWEFNNWICSQSYEKVKLMQRNVFLSPIDYGNLYFALTKKLEIAEQIRQDLKDLFDEQALFKKKHPGSSSYRIKFSRVALDLNHFAKNCKIPGIAEIDKVVGQI